MGGDRATFYMPMICGGVFQEGRGQKQYSKDCITLENKQFEIKSDLMNFKRSDQVGGAMINGSLLAIGGKSDSSAKMETIEMIHPTDGSKSLPDFLHGSRSHCLTKLNDKQVMVSGGHKTGQDYASDVVILDLTTNTWTPTHSLKLGRGSHGCGTFWMKGRQIAIVGGGYAKLNHGYGYIDSVELLDLQLDAGWVAGPRLDVKNSRQQYLTSPNGQGIIALGGKATSYYNTIYEFKCDPGNSLDECQWFTLQQKLKYAWAKFAAMYIPDSLANELCKQIFKDIFVYILGFPDFFGNCLVELVSIIIVITSK